MIDREELLAILSDPEFDRALTTAKIVRSMGPPLSRAKDFEEADHGGP
jgi:hypothetical protein